MHFFSFSDVKNGEVDNFMKIGEKALAPILFGQIKQPIIMHDQQVQK